MLPLGGPFLLQIGTGTGPVTRAVLFCDAYFATRSTTAYIGSFETLNSVDEPSIV